MNAAEFINSLSFGPTPERTQREQDLVLLARATGEPILSRPALVALLSDAALEHLIAVHLEAYLENI